MLLFNCGHARALKTIAAFEEEFRSTSNLEREHEGGSQCIIAHGHVLPLYILTNLDRGGACLERIIFFFRSSMQATLQVHLLSARKCACINKLMTTQHCQMMKPTTT